MGNDFLGPCMCRSVMSTWEHEYPFVRQEVMHSPVGCIRKELTEADLRKLYFHLTGLQFENPDMRSLFQAVMSYFALNPDVAKRFPTLVLTPGTTYPPREFSPEPQPKPRARVTVPPASKTPPANPQPSTIIPPWLRKD